MITLGKTLRSLPLAAVLAVPEWSSAGESPAKLQEMALKIDRQVAAFYRAKSLPVPEVADDATFLRRVFLVAIGRIPTAEEAIFFLETDEPAKREKLVEYLMRSPGYSSHMTNWAFDLLRVTDRPSTSPAALEPYREWVRQAMAGNMPWDQFTVRLLASSGSGWDPENAAVGYYVRDRGMPLDNLSNTMRVFLGERMECAQCHDDPFGTTERMDFYQLAAFTHGQEPLNRRHMQPLWDELSEGEQRDSHEYRVARLLWDQIYGLSLGGGGDGRIELPSDYQNPDGEPGETVGGRTPFGKVVRTSERRKADDGRAQLADWLVNRTGDRFASVIANRMWRRVMGRAFFEPVDEYQPPSKTHHPELAKLLATLMAELKYDLRDFQQVLLLTRTFAFATNPHPSKVEAGDDFHGRKIERLSAEQIWDSLLTLVAGDPDRNPPRKADPRVMLDGKPVLVGRKTMKELSKEVLELGSEDEVRTYFAKLVDDIRSDSPSEGGGSMMMMETGKRYDSGAMVRASELPSPAPRGHLLYLFGASDREVVEGASREPNVGQVLSLMNGVVQEKLVGNPRAHLYQALEGAGTDAEKVRRLYIAILSRPPGGEEMEWMLEEIRARGDEGCRNIVSSLVMSSEFLFLQ